MKTPSHHYKAKAFVLKDLHGISEQTLETHFKLYEGYVKETNRLGERIQEFLKDGRVDEEEMPAYSELKRRLSFEYNGMVLHEHYFENLKSGGSADIQKDAIFLDAVELSFGSFETWKTDFSSVGKMRGIGWAICYQDPATQRLSNHWITLHEAGNIAGFKPLLVMDVWEHAFLLDYKPADKGRYIEAFFANIDWSVVEYRLRKN